MKLTKYLCHTLAYFHKDSAASCKEIQTGYNKEDCDD